MASAIITFEYTSFYYLKSVKIFRMDELITPGVSGTLYYIQW